MTSGADYARKSDDANPILKFDRGNGEVGAALRFDTHGEIDIRGLIKLY